MTNDVSSLSQRLAEDAKFKHDLLNRVGAAKMSAELAGRSRDLPEMVQKNLARVVSNLEIIHKMINAGADSAETSVVTNVTAANETAKRAASLLLIDDSDDLRALFRQILAPRGYAVSVVPGITEALEFLSQGALPDLILLDYSLGHRKGTELLDELERSQPEVLKKSKVILFTGYGDRVQDARVVGIEQKALDIAGLLRVVKKYTEN